MAGSDKKSVGERLQGDLMICAEPRIAQVQEGVG